MVHEVADDGKLHLCIRWSGYHPDEAALELASRLDLRMVHQYTRRVGLRLEEAVAVVDFLAYGNPPGGTRGFQVSNRRGISANDTYFVGGHVAAVGTIAAVRRHGDPPHGHGVRPSRSGIVDVPGRGCVCRQTRADCWGCGCAGGIRWGSGSRSRGSSRD